MHREVVEPVRPRRQPPPGAARQPHDAPGLQSLRLRPAARLQPPLAAHHEHQHVQVGLHVDGHLGTRGEPHHVRVELPLLDGEPPQGAALVGGHRAYEIGHSGEHARLRGRCHVVPPENTNTG
ncbi:hypothetical protein J116_023675 [Streptomyces thermolilacinus SPC6]|uniref:Uncharacterized protein n=1 Tax=Streptomyces thermolilacinus SPC6 TaxID=1306406 RepID=A0A1D3DXE4_9ACTN|nr:hypothetical protein J116_023675 [Streptomyces thermolilacinus SPC6]